MLPTCSESKISVPPTGPYLFRWKMSDGSESVHSLSTKVMRLKEHEQCG